MENKIEPTTQNEQLSAEMEQVKDKQKGVRKKSTMLLLTALLLIVVLAVLAIAWYTRVANTYAVNFDVADYDLTVNENADDEYLLNVYDYAGLTKKLVSVTADGKTMEQHATMAPGTIGWIPLKISAYHSDVDVQYYISLDSKMPKELYQHMRFFILAEKNPEASKKTASVSGSQVSNQDGNYAFVYGNALQNVSDISNYKKIYLDQNYKTITHSGEDGNTTTTYEPDSDSLTVLSDKIRLGEDGVKTLCIYWEWYLDADAAKADNKPGLPDSLNADAKSAWDELDTDVGRYPDKYQDAFTMYLKTSGTQVTPTTGTRK